MSFSKMPLKKRKKENIMPEKIESNENEVVTDETDDENEPDDCEEPLLDDPVEDEQPNQVQKKAKRPLCAANSKEQRYRDFIVRGHELFKEKESKDGSVTKVYVGRTVYVKRIENNTDDGTVQLLLRFFFNNEWKEVRVKRSQLQLRELTKLMDFGLDVPDFKARDVARFLSYQENDADIVYYHEQLGWVKKDEQLMFKHQKIIGCNDCSSVFQGEVDLVKGSFKGWRRVIKQEVLGQTPLEFALVCGFAAPLVSLLAKDLDTEVLIFHLFGESSLGKTTAARIVVSPFGRPSRKEKGLMYQWKSSQNGTVAQFVNKHGIPLVLDEASMNRIKDFTDVIYQLAEGREKARMTKELKEQKRRAWSGLIFSTAEHSLLQKSNQNSGLRVRVQEIGNLVWTKSKENAETIERELLKHYGHAGPMFAEYLLKVGEQAITELWAKWTEAFYNRMEVKDNLSQRISNKYGLILATAELVNRRFDFAIDLEKLASFLLEIEQSSAGERDLGERAYQYLRQMVIQHQNNFIRKNLIPKGECWGKITHQSGRPTKVMFLKEPFKKLIFQGSFDDCSVVLRKLKEKKYLDHEDKKHTRKKKIHPNADREDVYCLLFDENFHQILEKGVSTIADITTAKRHSNAVINTDIVDDMSEFD